MYDACISIAFLLFSLMAIIGYVIDLEYVVVEQLSSAINIFQNPLVIFIDRFKA